MPPEEEFTYDWTLRLSKYNTLRYEEKNREKWKEIGLGQFVRNDRFCLKEKPSTVQITIRKTYIIKLE